MKQSSPTPSERPDGSNSRQERICNALTLIGLVAVIIVGAANIFAPEAAATPEQAAEQTAAPSHGSAPCEPLPDFNEEDFTKSAPKPAPADTLPADTVAPSLPADTAATAAPVRHNAHPAPHDSTAHHHHEVHAVPDSL